ncbi:MAG: hypothetical protein J6386_22260 [Candidatus Synoicihabitans palmerolidicus]|nr:hypothetical protein [Candidatus Synoicihabitans palmerolidicus]
MCRNQEILPGSASLFLRYLFFSNLLRLWNTLYLTNECPPLTHQYATCSITDHLDPHQL